MGKWLFRRPKEKQASSDAADAGLGVSADAADAGRMLLMLVVSGPRCACVSSILALGVLQHVCLSMFGEKLQSLSGKELIFVTMAASVRSKLKLGISECRCVASPAPARAFVPARAPQVDLSGHGERRRESRGAGGGPGAGCHSWRGS